MTPNYFRFVKRDETASGGNPYDGYSLREDESFETSGWSVYNYSATGFTSRETESFESGSVASGFFPIDNTDWWS